MYIISILSVMVIFLTGLMLTYTISDIWEDNMYLISMVWAIVLFLIREKINLFLLSRSKLFELVPHAIQKQDSHLLTHCWVSILLYIPMITRLIWELLYNGPVGFLDFIPITRCLLAMGIVGEIIDLVTKYRVPFNMLLHHSLEIIGGSIMIGGNIISFEPGFIMLAIPTIFSRFHITVFILDHISREGVSDDFIGELCLSPKFLGRMYFYSSVCEIISILVHCFFTGIYMFKYWLEIEEFNRIFLLVLIVLFAVSDIPTATLCYRKSKLANLSTITTEV